MMTESEERVLCALIWAAALCFVVWACAGGAR
jgi:hypothetical protein